MMKYLETGNTDPYYNLAVEEFIFEQMDRTDDYFMLWQNSPSVIIGKYQNAREEINSRFVEKKQLKVARRLSGGGAVYHDMGNLNFTYIVGKRRDMLSDFRFFSEPIIEALRYIGLCAECTGRNDITIDGAKIAGNSQYLKNGRLLHHGCLMLDTNLEDVVDALTPDPAKIESKATKSLRSRITTINEKLSVPVSIEEFKGILKRCVFGTGNASTYMFSPEIRLEIFRLRNDKYATWEWNYGQAPSFSVKRKKRFPAGSVEIQMDVERGRISRINFFGDFFCYGDINELEHSLEGVLIDDQLEQSLAELDVGHFLCDITSEDIAALLR